MEDDVDRRSNGLTVLAVAVAMLAAAACSGKSPRDHRSVGPRSSPSVSGGANNGQFYPLGSVSSGGGIGGIPPEDCLSGDQCQQVTVDCAGVGVRNRAILDIGKPSGSVRGLVVFLSGGGGNKLWSSEAKLAGAGSQQQVDPEAARMGKAFLSTLQSKGFQTVQVVWHPMPWLASPQGQQVGPGRLACAPATVLKWIHDTMYEQLGAHPSGLACGFCVVGNSGGASQIAYSLGFYGLGDIIDGAVLSGGPPHAYFDRACLNESGWTYAPGFYVNFDASYGFGLQTRGPCAMHDQSWASRWTTDDVIDGAVSFKLPNTRVLFIWGSLDPTGAEPHQIAYEDRLKRAGSPHVKRIVVPNMTHDITASSAGLNDIDDQILGT